MRSVVIKRLAGTAGLALAIVTGSTGVTAQNRGQWQKHQNQAIKAQQKAEKERIKLEQERLRLERQRLQSQARRYRVNRGGQWYNTDQRGADLLRQAINEGYRQGFAAGKNDRLSRRRLNISGSSIYRSGTYGYQSFVDRGTYQYYFRQGFERGYQDGFNSRYQYGSNSNGVLNILGSVLGGVLNLQQY